MNRQGITVFGCASLVALVAGCATSEVGPAPIVPDELKAPAAQTLSLETRAAGVQIYDCKPSKDDPARFEWVFKAPEAVLYDANGNQIGRHYAGPTWESNDGSKAVGETKAHRDSPDVNAIPWLLLSVRSASGAGALGRTLSVQRLDTVGGKAPADGCSPTQAGNVARVPYSARYYFYVAGPQRASAPRIVGGY